MTYPANKGLNQKMLNTKRQKKLAEDNFPLNGGPCGKKETRKVGDKDGAVSKGTG